MRDSLGRRAPRGRRTRVRGGAVVSRRCARCGKWKDIGDFLIYYHSKRKRRYYAPYCADCRQKKVLIKHYRKTRRDKLGLLMYSCSKCGQFKYDVDFYFDRYHNQYRSACKDCYNKLRKETRHV